jgi:flagellar biosynthesis protein FlhF
MDIRTFEAFSMKDAVKSVKKALGADAVILSTKERPGPDGKGKTYEVTAAAAGTVRRPRQEGAPELFGATAETTRMPGIAPVTGALEPITERLEALAGRVTLLADEVPSKHQVQALEAGMQELKLLLLESLRGKDGSSLKDVPAAIVPIERQLRVMGVDDVSIAELVKQLRSLPPPDKAETAAAGAEGYYRDQAMRWLMKRIKIAPRWSVVSGSVGWHAIVGPAGSGKTTMVAKLAAHYAMREKAKVAVVSLDDRRLAGGEQLRIFCKIIDVPFTALPASTSAEDVAAAVDRLGKFDLVLIDTPGVSAKDGATLGELAKLRGTGNLPIDCHLCLAATEKETQMEAAVRAYSRLGLASLVYTKLDESWAYGEIYNLSRRWALPLSFFATGQRIPEDVERATRERVVERLFGI